MIDHHTSQLNRIERKIDLMLQLQGFTIHDIEQLGDDKADAAAMQALIDKMKASATTLAAAVAANQPK